MSYCRFSCDDWQSDIYAYDGERGIHINVAARRVVGPVPPLEWVDGAPTLASVQAQHAYLRTAKRERIGLRYDGDSFLRSTPEYALQALRMLAAMGYRVPQHAIDALREEIHAGEREGGAV